VGLFASSIAIHTLQQALKTKLDEVPANMLGIQVAQRAHHARHGRFVSAGPHPVPVAEVRGGMHLWTEGSGFDTIGWAPDWQARGTYQVEVSADGSDFIIHGWIDEDEDGEAAHYTATKATDPVKRTPKTVY